MAGGPRDPRPGDLVGGHRIERPLGAGAMGTVWLAEHVTLGRRVALKILAHGLADDPSFQDRFMREARLAARLDHQNVVAVYDAGTDDAGLWLSMRFVEGEDLRKRLNRVAAATGDGRGGARGSTDGGGSAGDRPARSATAFRRPDAVSAGRGTSGPEADADDPTVAVGRDARRPPGGLPPGEVLRIVEGVAAGLDHAHSRGILHRDVKPGNVLLEAEEGVVPTPAPPVRGDGPAILELPPFQRVLLADFGLTKELEEATDLTQTGMLLGSADSVAPEQIEGHDTDGRVDVYALGSLLYVALTGAAPFPGATMAKLFAHVNGDRPRASDAFPQLRAFDAVLAAGMAIDPADRPGTAGELAALARTALEQSDVDPQATVAFPAPAADGPSRHARPAGRGTDRLAALAAERPPRPRPTPPVPGVAPPVRMREEPTPPPEPRTRALPQDGRTRVAPAVGGASADERDATGRAAGGPPTGRQARAGAGAGPPTGRSTAGPTTGRPGPAAGPPQVPGDGPPRGSGGTPPWLVPALVVGGLAIALVVVLALALGGGSDEPSGSQRADGPATSTERTTSTRQEPAEETTPVAPEQPTQTDPPATTSTAEAPATDEAIQVRGGGTIVAGPATRDVAADQPLGGGGVSADYSAPDGAWGSLLARPGNGWNTPRRTSQGDALMRLRQSGPGGRLILVDHTPTQAASFDTSNVLETRTIAGTRFGDQPGYRFKDARIASISECARLQCVDVPLNASPQGPGWGVLVAAPTAAEAWAVAERVARATGP